MVLYLKKHFKKLLIKERLNENIQLIFLKRLHHLLNLGYPILDALEVMKWDPRLASISDTIKHNLTRGLRIDKALDKAKFHDSIVAYLYFVSINGNLTLSLEKCISMFEQRMNHIKRFNKIIRYPIVLLGVFTILLIFLKRSVLPSFFELFQSNTEASKTVLWSLIIVDFFIINVFIVFITLIGGSLIWHKIKDNIPIDTKIKIYNKIPLYRNYLTMQTSYYFSTHISMFLKAGLSMKDILHAIKEQNKFPIIRYYATLMADQLSKGQKIDHLLMVLPFVEKQLVYIFQKIDDHETLQRDLTAYSYYIAEQMEEKIMRFIQLVQPTIFILLALFIIFIYIALMWPMYQVMKTI